MKLVSKYLISFIVVIFFVGTTQFSFSQENIPDWVRNTAGWWAQGLIEDSDFVGGIEYLIENKIMIIPPTTAGTQTSDGIPTWVKNNAGWWAERTITDSDFVNGIQYLIKTGIMNLDAKSDAATKNKIETPSDKQADDKLSSGISILKKAPSETKDYTVLVYMIGSDLEKHPKKKSWDYKATFDIEEMIAAKPSDKINVIVATGGSFKATPDIKSKGKRSVDFTTVNILQVTDKGVKKVEELGVKNMGAQNLLAEFLVWSAKAYPAEKFVLILWSHGSGINGYGLDNIHKDSTISLEQLDEALTHAKKQTNVTYEMIGFDACLMATIEVADAIKSHSRYMVASEELETGIGWDYASIISQLKKNSKQSGADLGKTIVNTFMADVKKLSKGDKYDPHLTATLSVIDLSKIESLGNSLKELGKSLQTFKLDKVSDLSDALNRAERFGQKKTRDSGHIDLEHFSQIVANKIPKFANEANAVISGVKDAVIYEDSGKSRPNAYGLSIYFPRTESVVTTDYIYGATKGMNDFYSDHLESDKTAPGLDVFLDENVIKGTYTDDDVYEINFYFMAEPDEQGVTEIFSTDEYDADEFPPGEINYEWNGYEPSLCNSQFCYPISPEWEWGENNNMAYLPVIVYTDLESSGLEGDLMYDVTDKDAPIFIGFWPLSQDESAFQKDLLPLKEGDIVQILSTLYDSQGIIYEPAERLIVDSEFRFSWKVYNWGALNVWVEICDYSNNCTWSEESFSLDGPEVADVDPSEIIPFEQNDPLNMDYEYEGEYVLDYKYDYDDYDDYDYDDYNYDEYYDDYDEYYEYIEDEVCWIDESGYAFCESGGCGEDEEGFWICNGDYYGEVVEDSCYVDESGLGVCESGGCGEDEYDNWICHDEYYGLVNYGGEVDEQCWYDDEGYGVCPSSGCGVDEDGYEVCDGVYYG